MTICPRTSKRLGMALMAALLVLTAAESWSSPRIYVAAAIAFTGTYWQLDRPKAKDDQ
jgi:hypothetical protein